LLDELPCRERFEQVDKLMGSLPNLSPTRLETLLEGCHNVKVRRLFFFADRHKHTWLKRLNKKRSISAWASACSCGAANSTGDIRSPFRRI